MGKVRILTVVISLIIYKDKLCLSLLSLFISQKGLACKIHKIIVNYFANLKKKQSEKAWITVLTAKE